jgi:hypothetical protein
MASLVNKQTEKQEEKKKGKEKSIKVKSSQDRRNC